MRIMSSTELRANLASVLDRVAEDHAPVIIHRAKGKPVVMVSLEDWEAMDETTYLLSSPANAAALRRGIAGIEAGDVVIKTMEELEAMAKE
jgi:antitoxin YefM